MTGRSKPDAVPRGEFGYSHDTKPIERRCYKPNPQLDLSPTGFAPTGQHPTARALKL